MPDNLFKEHLSPAHSTVGHLLMQVHHHVQCRSDEQLLVTYSPEGVSD